MLSVILYLPSLNHHEVTFNNSFADFETVNNKSPTMSKLNIQNVKMSVLFTSTIDNIVRYLKWSEKYMF